LLVRYIFWFLCTTLQEGMMITKHESIQVVGRGTQITFSISDNVGLSTVINDLTSYLHQNRSWFVDGTIDVNVGKRIFNSSDLKVIQDTINSNSGLHILKFSAKSGEVGLLPSDKICTELEIATGKDNDFLDDNFLANPPSQENIDSVAQCSDESDTSVEELYVKGVESLLIKDPCRSGELIDYPGNVIVMADVNPGAQIYASGDIVVYGRLRGFCHAGFSDNEGAIITALSMETNLLSIASVNGTSVESHVKPNLARPTPKIAYLRRGSVFVAPYLGRFSTYAGGTIYDR
jgi:septum site-determining protein MinC